MSCDSTEDCRFRKGGAGHVRCAVQASDNFAGGVQSSNAVAKDIAYPHVFVDCNAAIGAKDGRGRRVGMKGGSFDLAQVPYS